MSESKLPKFYTIKCINCKKIIGYSFSVYSASNSYYCPKCYSELKEEKENV